MSKLEDGKTQKGGTEEKVGSFKTSRATTSTTQHEQDSEDEGLEEKMVVVGGETSLIRWNDKVMYMDNRKRNINITDNPLCKIRGISICATKDKIIFSGGYLENILAPHRLSTVHQFCVHTCKWSQLADLLYPRDHHSSVCTDNQLYVIGGYVVHGKPFEHNSEVHVLDLNSRSWTVVKNMPTELTFSPDLAVVGTSIIVVGAGLAEAYGLNWPIETYMYQTLTDQWKRCQDMPLTMQVRYYAHNSTVAVGHKVFVLSFPNFLVYDTVEDHWTKLVSPIRPCSDAAMVLKQGKLIVLGGRDGSRHWPRKVYGLIQTYDVDRQRWSLEEKTMSVPLAMHAAFVMKVHRPQALSMALLVKTFVMVVVSLGLAWSMFFIFSRLFGN